MKKILLLLCTFLCSVGMWAADGDVVATIDLTTKSTSASAYASEYSVGNWKVMGANNNGTWAYFRIGGKASKSGTNENLDRTITGTTSLAKAVKEIQITHNGFGGKNATAVAAFNITSIDVEIADNSNFTSSTKTTFNSFSTFDNSAVNTGAGTENLTPATAWAKDKYYRITLHCTMTNTNNCGLDVYTVKFIEKGETPVGPVDPTITATNKTVGIEDVVDVAEMFTSNSTGAMTYSITAAPAGAVEDEDYILDGSEFYATKAGVYTVTATQAAVAGTYNSGSQTATITVSQAYTVSFGSPSNGSFVVKQGENILSSGAQVLAGTVLNLEATPAAGYMFASWSVTGATPVSETSKSTTLTVDNNVSINANFEVTTDIEITYNFNDKNNFPSGFPTGGTQTASAQRFSIGGNDLIINAPDTYYNINSTTENCGLFFGKTKNSSNKPQSGTAYLGFPAKAGYKLVKVSATSTNGIAGNLPLNVYTTSLLAVSTASNTVNGAKTKHDFTLNNSDANTEYWLTAGGTSGKNLQFDNIVLTYEKVTSEEITISSAGYATFVPKCNLNFSESDVTAYAVTPANDKVVLTAKAQVPAGKAIVVKAPQGNYTVPAIDSAEDFTTALEVSATAITAKEGDEYTYYYLGQDAGVVGFRPLKVDGTLAAGKCFFKVATAGARFMRIATEGETTGIKTIESAKNNAVIYNLAGQRVAANAKGIVIVNGKKMLNK